MDGAEEDLALGVTKDALAAASVNPHWSVLLSSAHLLGAAEDEWRPCIRLMRRISAAVTWEETCALLGQELSALSGADRITLYAAVDPDSEPLVYPILGEPLPYPESLANAGDIAVDQQTMVIRLTADPVFLLVLDKRGEAESAKRLLVIAPEIGEVLKSKWPELSKDPHTAYVPPRVPNTDTHWTTDFRGRLHAIHDEWQRTHQSVSALKALELDALRTHDRLTFEAAWNEHDAQLGTLQELEERREHAWGELLREAKLRIDSRWERAEQELRRDGQELNDSFVERLGTVERLLVEMGPGELHPTEDSA